MAKSCKNLKSVSGWALLLVMLAGSSAAAADKGTAATAALTPEQIKIREFADNEAVVRKQILADIAGQKKTVEEMIGRNEFPEAASACDALIRQLSTIPGTEAKAKLQEMFAFRKALRNRWTAYVLEKAQDLFDAKKFEEAIALCSTINIIDEENGNAISAPFIDRCHKEIRSSEYKSAIDVKKFDPDREQEIRDIDRLMREAQTFYNNGRYQEVLPVLEKVYLIDPFNIRATTLLDKTYGKIYSMARARHRVTTQEMLAMVDWDWVMPLKVTKPKRQETEEVASETKTARNKIEERMDKIIFAKFDSPGMDIRKILNFLDEKSKGYDREGIGVSIIPQFTNEEIRQPKFQKIYMRFNAIPLSDILRYLCMNLGIKYKIDEYGSIIVGTAIDDMVKTPRYLPVPDQMIADIINGTSASSAAVADAGDAAPAEGEAEAAAPAAPSSSSAAEAERKMKAYFSDRGIQFPAGSSIRYNRRMNRLEVINSEENLRRLEELVRQIRVFDVKMVMTEVKFIEITENDFNQLGFDWKFSLSDPTRKNGLWNFTSGTNFISAADQTENPTAFIQNLNLLPNFDGDWGGLKPSLNVTVHALSKSDSVEVLTTPRLISKSGMEASINMTTSTKYPDSWDAPEIETDDGNTSITFPVPDLGEEMPSGITLKVTPHVNPDNTITLELLPEIRVFLGSANSGYPVPVQQGTVNRETNEKVPSIVNETFNIWMPEFGVRRIEAKVKVEDGETIVLGGIINSSIDRKEEKMPLLGSIPLLGRFFQNRSEDSQKTNLLIFVTARLIDTDGHLVKAVENNGTPHFNF